MSVSHSHSAEAHAHPEFGFLRKYIFSEDHKIIGIQFLFSGLIFFLDRRHAGAAGASPDWLPARASNHCRWFPASWGGRMSPDFYAMIFSMHATIMIFFVIIPLLTGAFGNFTIPLMIGAQGHGVSEAEHDVVLVHVAGFRGDSQQFLRRGRRGRFRLDLVSAVGQRHHAGRRRRTVAGFAALRPRTNLLARRPAVRRHLVDDGFGQLSDDHHQLAVHRHDVVPHAVDRVGHVHHRHPASDGSARA